MERHILREGTSSCSIRSSGSRLVRDTSARLRVPSSAPDSLSLSKSDHVVPITWSPSGYTPVGPECPAMLFTNHNKPKIHVICYITRVFVYLFAFFYFHSVLRQNGKIHCVWKT